MNRDVYTPPKSETVESTAVVSDTFSNASGRKKLLLGGIGALLSSVLAFLGLFSAFTKLFAIILGAYAVVGLIEILAGGSLVSLSKRWDQLNGFKQFLISVAVILLSFVLFMSIMPIVAEITMN